MALSLFSFVVLLVFGRGPCSEVEVQTCSPSARRGWGNEWPKGLDFGIYWRGPNETFQRAGTSGSLSYDPTKPVVLFFHGWEGAFGGSIKTCFRSNTQCEPCYDRLGIADSWFQGWNVGWFYWDQFADEPCVRDAEYKIWQSGQQPLRWYSNDCEGPDYVGKLDHHNYDGRGDNVGALCAQTVKDVLGGFNGLEIRFVGESLGAQLAAKCADLVYSGGIISAPGRVVMLEPAFSHYGFAGMLQCKHVANSSDFGRMALQSTNQALEKLKTWNVTSELYTTATGFLEWAVDASPKLYHDYHVRYHPKWCSTLHRYFQFNSYNVAGCYHNSVVSLYFLSMGAPPLPPNGRSSCRVPSAASTYDEIWHLKSNCDLGHGIPHYEHSDGMHTLGTADDAFSVQMKKNLHASKSSLLERWVLPRSRDSGHSSWLTSNGTVACLIGGITFSLLVVVALRRRREDGGNYATVTMPEDF